MFTLLSISSYFLKEQPKLKKSVSDWCSKKQVTCWKAVVWCDQQHGGVSREAPNLPLDPAEGAIELQEQQTEQEGGGERRRGWRRKLERKNKEKKKSALFVPQYMSSKYHEPIHSFPLLLGTIKVDRSGMAGLKLSVSTQVRCLLLSFSTVSF